MNIAKNDYFIASIDGSRVLVRIASVKDNGLITAWRVKKTGERFEVERKDSIEQHLLFLRAANLRKRMKMNLHYGELEADKDQS